MGELRQIPFTIERDTVSDVVNMYDESRQHFAVVHWSEDDSVTVDCKCGGHWKIDKEKVSETEIKATFNSHLSYFNRPALKPD